MSGEEARRRRRCLVAWGVAAALAATAAAAQRLPLRRFTAADGLAHDRIERIYADSRGFLWFCTYDGLSRFDGRRFTSYGFVEGLRHPRLIDLLEAADGSYWLASAGGGVVRFEPAGARPGESAPRFLPVPFVGDDQPSVIRLWQDRGGRIWAGATSGLYRLDTAAAPAFRPVDLGARRGLADRIEVVGLAEGPDGSLWVGADRGLFRRLPTGRIVHYRIAGLSDDRVWALASDGRGRVWAGVREGLFVLQPDPAATAAGGLLEPAACAAAAGAATPAAAVRLPASPGELCRYTTADGLGHDQALTLLSRGETVWIGTNGGGVTRFDGRGFSTWGEASGVDARINALAVDRGGHLWLGTSTFGALRLGTSGLETFLPVDGLGNAEVLSIFETRAGEVAVLGPQWTLSWSDGGVFRAVRPRLPAEMLAAHRGRWEVLQDHAGEWWAATGQGLYRFPRVERLAELADALPRAVYTTRDGLPDDLISRLFEDSRGDLWISSYRPPVMLARWERATGTFHRYGEAEGLPLDNWANAFAEDAAGQLWLGLHNGGLARLRHGRFELFGEAEGVPPGFVQGLYRDQAGRLWIATSAGGAARVDDPAAARPRFVTYTVADKLASNNLRCFAEDGAGSLYVGTARGVDRLQLADGRIEHYAGGADLPASEVTAALRDRSGTLWFGTRRGLTRLRTAPARRPPAPEVWLERLRIAGVDHALFELGVRDVGELVLAPHQRQVEVEFFALDFAADSWLGYEVRINGGDWSPARERRTIAATLAPGPFRLEVRAVRGDGAVSPEPATLALRLLPPIWRRAWFVDLVSVVVLAAGVVLYRLRVRRLLAVERMRTRIAADLHDDIGASLSRIAILSEVVKRGAGGADPEARKRLSEIADSARGLIDAMSDIVWAIDPRKDRGDDLVRRLRAWASDLLEPEGIRWQCTAPPELAGARLAPETRRHLMLIAKEAIRNVERHAGASQVAIDLALAGRELRLEIRDDGAGFDPARAAASAGRGGNGLRNLAARSAALGGELTVDSAPGRGTRLVVRVPLGRRSWPRQRGGA